MSTHVTLGPIPFTLVQELYGAVFACKKCGRQAASLRRKSRGFRSYNSYYTHCRACHQETTIGTDQGARLWIKNVAPQLLDQAFDKPETR